MYGLTDILLRVGNIGSRRGRRRSGSRKRLTERHTILIEGYAPALVRMCGRIGRNGNVIFHGRCADADILPVFDLHRRGQVVRAGSDLDAAVFRHAGFGYRIGWNLRQITLIDRDAAWADTPCIFEIIRDRRSARFGKLDVVLFHRVCWNSFRSA